MTVIPIPNEDDAAIIRRVLSGRTDDFAELVRRHQGKILRLCGSLLRNSGEAEDAAQESFIKAYQSLSRFQGTSSFYTWLYRIASNHCLTLLRSKSRKASESWDELLEKEGEKAQGLFLGGADHSDELAGKELAGKLLESVRPEYRVVLSLREIEGLSYEEIAQALSCSIDSVKARLRRAREELAEKHATLFKEKSV